jgi:hypothetical protein
MCLLDIQDPRLKTTRRKLICRYTFRFLISRHRVGRKTDTVDLKIQLTSFHFTNVSEIFTNLLWMMKNSIFVGGEGNNNNFLNLTSAVILVLSVDEIS